MHHVSGPGPWSDRRPHALALSRPPRRTVRLAPLPSAVRALTAPSPRGPARVGVAQHFGLDGVAALEALPDREMELGTKHSNPLGEEEMRAMCAVLGRPRVAGQLTCIDLGCLPSRHLILNSCFPIPRWRGVVSGEGWE